SAVLEYLDVRSEGLDGATVRERRATHGPNVVGAEKRVSAVRILAHQFTGALVLV
ncbi:MAG: hypothetical protein GWM90_18845, partial [Gemmatimonadetes bacterium]|nr:hypothetical protein [Gemmatimonadota bacterium]NIR38599.1 hypothetical protein [Actinomycetota bacterium]NIU76632.1 hypothetical protein [Gammaproteobacteria bacterium]NIQ56443.1 hypothetical protein [Gemmatimonadota bacterium]NIX46072.1 hypothetical protein [Gemmatimonadota bacterium]